MGKHLSVLPQIPKPTITIMSGNSSVGQSGVYEAGDQRNYKDSELKAAQEPYQEGKENSHKNLDSKDERSIANKLAAEERNKGPSDDRETAFQEGPHSARTTARQRAFKGSQARR